MKIEIGKAKDQFSKLLKFKPRQIPITPKVPSINSLDCKLASIYSHDSKNFRQLKYKSLTPDFSSDNNLCKILVVACLNDDSVSSLVSVTRKGKGVRPRANDGGVSRGRITVLTFAGRGTRAVVATVRLRKI